MRIFFLILLGLSLSTIAQGGNISQPHQEKVVSQPKKEKETHPREICDPNQKLKIPEIFN